MSTQVLNSVDEFESYSVYIVTIQSIIIKFLTEAIKDILPDTNIEVSKEGVRILSMDPTHTTLVHMNLGCANFEKFHVTHNQIIGVNMINLFKLIKTITNNDTLALFVHKNDMNHLGVKIENSSRKASTTFKLNLMDLNNGNIRIPPAQFSSVITMKSTDFQKICRDMVNISDEIEIKAVDNSLILTCKGEFAEQETVIGECSSNGISFCQNCKDSEIIQGIFSLKYLTLFAKCTNLCPSIQIYLKNDYPLIVCYNVGSLGEIKMCLAPKHATSS
ncbi:MAG: proliferating cell nuclear antigen (pcna) [Rhodobacteraceae bacterium]|nr:MAG: proliferating cell nuclear antigen (pcna) [Paracoccaceae bacterium]